MSLHNEITLEEKKIIAKALAYLQYHEPLDHIDIQRILGKLGQAHTCEFWLKILAKEL